MIMAPERHTAMTDLSVLVVDDDSDIRDLMSELLELAGYDVRTASNGLDALNTLHSAAPLPAVILLDINMPVMDGREFMVQRAKEAALEAIPVLVTSATAQRIEGAEALFRKPVDLDRLLAHVAAICTRGAARGH